MKRRAADLEANGAELMPREKLLKYGIEELNLPELLALVLGTGYGGKNVMQLSNEIVMDYGAAGLKDLKEINSLREVTGMPFVKSAMLLASLELGRRLCGRADDEEMIRVTQPGDVYPLTRDMWDLEQEQLRGIYLNTASKVIGTKVLTVGTRAMTRSPSPRPRRPDFPGAAREAP